MKLKYLFPFLLSLCSTVLGEQPTISENQKKWIEHYKKQANVPDPATMLINTDEEPDPNADGFVSLYNGKDLSGWTPLGGHCLFEANGEEIVGTCVPGSPSTYLTTDRQDYRDFIFTAEFFWEVDGNTGVIVRGATREGKQPGNENIIVYGPQVEMEEKSRQRFWSGGIYGQSAGGWSYPMWLNAHREVRDAIKYDQWNRVTVKAEGDVIKTWINGLPAAHWVSEKYRKGFISLQVHSGGKGTIKFKNIKIKELPKKNVWEPLFEADDFSKWQKPSGKPITSNWTIQDGIVHRSGIRPGGIITKKSYKNFDLTFEWKISEGGNSGVKYRTHPRKRTLGPEYQIIDDVKGKGVKVPSHRAGSLYDLVAAAEDKPIKPAGEWNTARIHVNGNHIEHWLNGEKIVAIQHGSDDWVKRFQQSKYKDNDGFGSWEGPILLQDHGSEVWFRNMRIKKL